MIYICVQEENRLSKTKSGTVNLVNFNAAKKPMVNTGKQTKPYTTSNVAANIASSSRGPQNYKVNLENVKCYFCKQLGHLKRDCEKRKKWAAKKGNKIVNVSVCFQTLLVEAPPNTWWFDTGCSVHITNSLQGFSRRASTSNEVFEVHVGNGNKVDVEAIGNLKLRLSSGFVLELFDVLYVPSLTRSLVSASKLVRNGFAFIGDDESIRLFMKNDLNYLLGVCLLDNDLWKLDCTFMNHLNCYNIDSSLQVKRPLSNDLSSMLWHRRLGHISKTRLQRLVKENILPDLNFTDLHVCVDCCKGKLTKIKRKNSTRSQKLLKVIHSDVCGPFPTKTICGNVYFVTFIDDFSRYGYVFLILEKSQVPNCFKIFKTEVENQLDTTIKVLRSDRGGEYFGRFTEAGQ